MSTWTFLERLSGAVSGTMNSSTITMDGTTYNFIGQLTAVWTNLTKH